MESIDMGLRIKIAGAEFSKSVARRLPYNDQALFHYLLGGTLADSLQNVVGPINGTQVGALTIGPNYIGCNKDIGIDSGLSYDDDFTFAGVTSRSAGAVILGAYVSTSNYDHIRIATSSFVPEGVGNGDTAATLAGPAAPNNGKYHFYALAKTGTTLRMYYQSGSGLVEVAGSVAANTAQVSSVRVGGAHQLATASRPFNLAMVAAYRVGLGASDIGDVYDYMKLKSAERGLLVY